MGSKNLQDDLLIDSKQQQFLEDVLLPRFCDELKIQNQLIISSLQEHMDTVLKQSGSRKNVGCPSLLPTPASLLPTPSSAVSSAYRDLSDRSANAMASLRLGRMIGTPVPSTSNVENSGLSSSDKEDSSSSRSADAIENLPPPKFDVKRSVMRFHSAAQHAKCKVTREVVHKFGILDLQEVEEGWREGRCQRCGRIVHSTEFRVLSSLIILANTFSIGIHTEAELTSVLNPDTQGRNLVVWNLVEDVFTALFTGELILRILAEGRGFYLGHNGFWNAVDTTLVIQALVSLALRWIPNVSFLRMLTAIRLLRLFRFLRVIRVIRQFRSFHVMTHSLLNSLSSLFWVLLMLLFVMYLFAMIIMHGLVRNLSHSDIQEGSREFLIREFGSVANSLLSLFMVITGGVDWGDLYRPLTELSVSYGKVLIVYIYFVVFGVLNVVISVFVDAAHKASMSDREYVVQSEIDRSKAYTQACRRFFNEADKDGSGALTWEELNEYLETPHNRAYLASLELDEAQARAMYTLVDIKGENRVRIDDFVQGCARLKGAAKALDVNMLLYAHELMMLHMEKMLAAIEFSVGVKPDDILSKHQACFSPGHGNNEFGHSEHSLLDSAIEHARVLRESIEMKPSNSTLSGVLDERSTPLSAATQMIRMNRDDSNILRGDSDVSPLSKSDDSPVVDSQSTACLTRRVTFEGLVTGKHLSL